MAEVAQREGFTVATAESLRTARAQLVRQPPDVLLTDLKLPDGNGMDLVGDLDRSTDTEIVVVTGHASVDSAVEALRVGATDYLIKPIDVDRLVNILRRQPKTADLKLEINAVAMYNKAVQIARDQGDDQSRELFSKLLKDEESHVDWLEAQMHQIKEMGYEQYLSNQTQGPKD